MAPKVKPIESKKETPKKTEEKKSEAAPAPPVKKPEPPKIEKKPVPASPEQGRARPAAQATGGEREILSPENEKKLLDQYEKSKKSRKYWHIEEIKDGVLVINLGAGDGLKPGASVQIARDGAFLAEATVRSLSQGYATAIVPQESAALVKAGDDVLFFNASA